MFISQLRLIANTRRIILVACMCWRICTCKQIEWGMGWNESVKSITFADRFGYQTNTRTKVILITQHVLGDPPKETDIRMVTNNPIEYIIIVVLMASS